LGLLEIPNDSDVAEFLLTGKKKTPAEISETANMAKRNGKPKSPTLKLIFELYFGEYPEDSIEKSTLDMLETHPINLERLMGGNTKIAASNIGILQDCIDKRSKERGRRGKIKPVTLRKEITC